MMKKESDMRDKRNFNNLFDSLCITLLFFIFLAFYLLIVYFGVINAKESTNPILLLIVSTTVFGIMMAAITVLVIKYCYEYWILSDDSIISKKILSKRTVIKLDEIEKVEKKIVPALILGIYKSEAYIISSKNSKITVLINERRKIADLDSVLFKFMNQ
jgi:hypothetical protein